MHLRKHLIYMTGFLLDQIRMIRLRQEDISVLDQAFILMEHKLWSMWKV